MLHLARRTGFGQAVEEAHRTAPAPTVEDLPYLKRPSGWDPVTRSWRDDTYDLPELPYGEPEHWLWLLHDDSAPEPEALAQLLRVVETEREAGRDDVAARDRQGRPSWRGSPGRSHHRRTPEAQHRSGNQPSGTPAELRAGGVGDLQPHAGRAEA